MLLAARLAWSNEHLNEHDCIKYTPKYCISATQGRSRPDKLVMVAQAMLFLGPTRKQHDLSKLMAISNQ